MPHGESAAMQRSPSWPAGNGSSPSAAKRKPHCLHCLTSASAPAGGEGGGTALPLDSFFELGVLELGAWPLLSAPALSAVAVCLLDQGLPLETYLVAYKYGAVVLFNVGNEEKQKQILKLCMPHISDPPRRGTTITDGATSAGPPLWP